ncbi:16S rRNA (guanine(527)-N(7))-methyltransferase RsmG [Desulfospira joergensenii]|uniref:16S rRNA (guanine(527)-N(7))-methyltransferase RsmG n=1 Tax=Desulfospira joergensenii TaxID=53329 RepID=UPI0003B49BDD|nr:16S rRNA (guanine(527)-N(7))-methyltransferase RsmG [Desulfospira joergensenii]
MTPKNMDNHILEFEKHLEQGIRDINLDLTDHQISLISAHARELTLWNKKINLTAITGPLDMAEKHFIDALAIYRFLGPGKRILDMGTGGGFPGIPLKILCPALEFSLVDASRKKINFLRHTIRTLGLEKIQALHSRAEDLHHDPEHAGKYDMVISRGFAHLEKFVGLARPFLRPGGIIYAMKGSQALDEITPDLENRFIIRTDAYRLPLQQSERVLVRLGPKDLPDGL